jgi:hypothetical protein
MYDDEVKLFRAQSSAMMNNNDNDIPHATQTNGTRNQGMNRYNDMSTKNETDVELNAISNC